MKAEQVLEEWKKLSPQERSQRMVSAVKFCREHKLITPLEWQRMAEDRKFQAEMGIKSMIREAIYRENHPE